MSIQGHATPHQHIAPDPRRPCRPVVPAPGLALRLRSGARNRPEVRHALSPAYPPGRPGLSGGGVAPAPATRPSAAPRLPPDGRRTGPVGRTHRRNAHPCETHRGRSMKRTLTTWLLDLAERIAPPYRRGWIDGLRAEAD